MKKIVPESRIRIFRAKVSALLTKFPKWLCVMRNDVMSSLNLARAREMLMIDAAVQIWRYFYAEIRSSKTIEAIAPSLVE